MGALFGVAILLVVVGVSVNVTRTEGAAWGMATALFLIGVALGAAELAGVVIPG